MNYIFAKTLLNLPLKHGIQSWQLQHDGLIRLQVAQDLERICRDRHGSRLLESAVGANDAAAVRTEAVQSRNDGFITDKAAA
jgi:hypothetical protein